MTNKTLFEIMTDLPGACARTPNSEQSANRRWQISLPVTTIVVAIFYDWVVGSYILRCKGYELRGPNIPKTTTIQSQSEQDSRISLRLVSPTLSTCDSRVELRWAVEPGLVVDNQRFNQINLILSYKVNNIFHSS